MLARWCVPWIVAVAIATLLASGAPVRAEAVVHEHAGLELSGNLVVPKDRSIDRDGVALILHGTLAHHGMEMIAALQRNLAAKGVPSLAITLSLGLNARKGMFDCALEQDHRNIDAVEELAAWVDWLKSKGVRRITVIGHSRGASQAAYFVRDVPGDVITGLVLVAPVIQSRATLAARYKAAFKADLEQVLAEARRLVDEGEDDKLMEVAFLTCPKARVTAAGFLDYYGEDRGAELTAVLPSLKLPVHIILAEKDAVANETPAALDAVAKVGNVKRATIADADHFFRDLTGEDLADAIATWIGRASGK